MPVKMSTNQMTCSNFDRILRCIRGAGFVFLIMYSTYFGTIFLLTPCLPLFLIAPRFARCISDPLIWIWKVYCVSVYEVLFQTKIRIYGDIPDHKACTLMLMNHRTRFDWLYLFSYQVRHASIRRYTISLKNILKQLPGIGWAMQLGGFIFLDRKWEDDQATISRLLKFFKQIEYKPQMLLFPEGTDLTKNTKARSDKYAEKANLPQYSYVLHPRTTGFSHFVQEMKRGDMLEYVSDITIAYPVNIPQNEMDIIRGNFPKEIHFLVDTFPNTEIPSHKDDLETWCRERWHTKEGILKDFYEKKSFDGSNKKEVFVNESLVSSAYVYAWLWWTMYELFIAYILWCYPVLWLYVLVCTIFYQLVSKYTSGLGIYVASTFGL